METKSVFLGGIPGAGKSTLGSLLQAVHPMVRHFTAGALIQAGLGRPTWSYQRPLVSDQGQAEFYQQVLLDEFLERQRNHQGPVLLDGHFVVPTGRGFYPVHAEIFRQMRIEELVIMTVIPLHAANRLNERGGAEWWDGTTHTLQQLHQMEHAHAEFIASTLGIPLQAFDDAEKAIGHLKAVFSQQATSA